MIEQIDAVLTVANQRGDELGLGPLALGVVRLNEISSSALLYLDKSTYLGQLVPARFVHGSNGRQIVGQDSLSSSVPALRAK